MTFTVNEVPTTCTAKHITGWDFQGDDGSEKWLYFRVKSFARVAIAADEDRYWLDHAFVFATVTEDQLDSGARRVLEALGFQNVFTGVKDRYESRETDSGDLHMFVVNPADLEDKTTAFISAYERKNKKDVSGQNRRSFKDITIGNLRNLGYITRLATPENTTALYMGQNFTRDNSLKDFGVDICPHKWSHSIETLEENHINWKQGLPNVFEV